MNNYRNRDSEVEHQISLYLDENFYNKIGATVIRHSDRETQLKGTDVTLSFKDLINVSVDEKALSHYINKNIPTFAFELSFLNKGDVIEGWLTDESKVTEYYLLIWIQANKEWDITKDDITQIEAYLISRKNILEYLKERGFDSNQLRNKASEIRTKCEDGAIEKNQHDGFYFYFTKERLVEKPINVIIKKSVLLSLSKYRFIN